MEQSLFVTYIVLLRHYLMGELPSSFVVPHSCGFRHIRYHISRFSLKYTLF